MKLFLSTFLLFFLCVVNSNAQKLLQIEKTGSQKTHRFYIGDPITFQLNGEKGWYERTITDINVDANTLIFSNGSVSIDKIKKVRTFKNRAWSRALSTNAFYGAGSFVILSLLGTLADVSLSAATVIIPGTTVLVGLAIRFIFRQKTHRIGKRRRLRALDLTFYKIGP